jgi:hypothetical protein
VRSGLGKADEDKNRCDETTVVVQREKHVSSDLVCAPSDMGR